MAIHDPTHLYQGEVTGNTRKAAKTISTITQPQVFSIIMYALVCLVCSTAWEFAYTYFTCVFFGCIFPIIEVLYYSKKFQNDDGDVVRKEDRFVPLLLGTISYVLGAIALWFIGAPRLVTVLFVCYAVVTFAIMLITPYWKISIHACGMIGPTMALTYAFYPIGMVPFLLVPFICWSRYVLKKHTPAQMVGGIVVGFVLTFAIFSIML